MVKKFILCSLLLLFGCTTLSSNSSSVPEMTPICKIKNITIYHYLHKFPGYENNIYVIPNFGSGQSPTIAVR